MSSVVLRQHLLLQWFDREPEDTSSIETHGTHYVRQIMFRVTGVGMPLVHIVQEQEKDQYTRVQASLLPQNVIHPSLVKPSGRHNLQLESTRVSVVCLRNSSDELELLSNYELFVVLSSVSFTISGLKKFLSPGSDQFNGVRHRRPYMASKGAILMLY
jgi:hypothetical protein